jgi:hypothetical protein
MGQHSKAAFTISDPCAEGSEIEVHNVSVDACLLSKYFPNLVSTMSSRSCVLAPVFEQDLVPCCLDGVRILFKSCPPLAQDDV